MLSTIDAITSSATIDQTILIFFPRKSMGKGYQFPSLSSLDRGDEVDSGAVFC